MNKLLKDAIADAKAVRETALAQAKLALEEAFAPKLQSMLSNKIMQEMETEESDDTTARMKELAGVYEADDEMGAEDEMGGDDLEMGDDEMGDMEGEEDTEFTVGGQTYNIVPAEDEEGLEGEEGMEDEEGMEGEDEELAELLRQLEEDEMGEARFDGKSKEQEADDEYSQYLTSLEGRGAAQDPDASDEENEYWRAMNSLEEMNDDKKKASSKFTQTQTEATPKPKGDFDPQSDEEEINLHELIQALKEEEGDEEYKKAPDQAMDTAKGSHGDVLDERKKMKKMEEDLNEAYTAVKYLREKLSEVNLLNAKLLYVNKLFRKNGLTETQKVKIIETFDRAKNVRETKLIYATLCESFNSPVVKAKKPVVENFASAPVKKTQVINEGNEQMNRFKKLAGIIKS